MSADDAEELRRVLLYDPLTGIFERAVRTSNRVKVGDRAGSLGHKGYLRIQFGGRQHYAHRLAWLYMTGQWPDGQIDHVNRIKTDNRWSNLRVVDNKTNHENRCDPLLNNSVGSLGVCRNGKGFGAGIQTNGKRVWLGTFPTREEAQKAYFDAKRRLHNGFVS